ncbi:hypothetical protein [Falsiroseomonas tokyonensis]|uniref:7TM-DISM receptor extracellular domain-containing protein n=1 Tax=Falsiroseomonas tokyonensis TaxID=430521 RepID=A0ABV7BS65_9PROT|nr:hypothetical protein [Falsiroseomonas tokyonensis]MBU8537673.1 hypothetical protein [Falsiroseomonas tokyonensis]
MLRGLIAGLLLALAGLPALAQGQPAPSRAIQCSAPLPSDQAWRVGSGFMMMEDLARHLNTSAPSLPLGPVRQTSKAVPTLEIAVSRPDWLTPAEWRHAFFEAVAYPDGISPIELRESHLQRGTVLPPSPQDGETVVSVLFPTLDSGWRPSSWQVLLLLCLDPVQQGASALRAQGRELRAYARQPLFVSTLRLSAAVGLLTVLAAYLVLAFAAARIHARQYEHSRRLLGPGAPAPLAYALRPTVIAQDSFGYCSLSRFQVLLFTLVLAGVYAYVMGRTGELPNLSQSVLTLLGVTLTGSTLARLTEGSPMQTANRLWLLGTGVLDPTPRLPRWTDLVESDGEIDVTRVQALLFSLFAAVALVVSGTGDLENFVLPDQLVTLIGISQAVYVAGRALPRDSAKRLNEEVASIRAAEQRAMADPADAAARKDFETARNAIASSLRDVFSERFCESRLRGLQPGERAQPPGVA